MTAQAPASCEMLEHRRDRVGGRVAAERVRALEPVPAEVDARPRRARRSRARGRSPPTRPGRRRRSTGRRSSRSNENRHGLRSPYTQISGACAGVADERVVGAAPCTPRAALGVGSMRRILPSSVSSDWPFPPRRGPGPRRPPRRRRRARCRASPSGPNVSSPPLWFGCGWSTTSTSRRVAVVGDVAAHRVLVDVRVAAAGRCSRRRASCRRART